jgi:hypothetical protein
VVTLAAALLSVASARVESVVLTRVGAHPAVRVSLSGTPGRVVLGRERGAVRVVVTDAVLGPRFSGARRVSWSPGGRTGPRWLSGSPGTWLQRIEVGEGSDLVYLVLRRFEQSAELRRDAQGLLVVLPRAISDEGERRPGGDASAGDTGSPPGVGAEDRPVPEDRLQGRPQPPSRSQPEGSSESEGSADDRDASPGETSVATLYPRLFPPGEEAPPAKIVPPVAERGLALGPFHLRGSVETRYVDADTYLQAADQRVRDHYAELDPRAALELPVGAGSLTAEYKPALRAFASYDQMNSNSHYLLGTLELPLGDRLRLRGDERFVTGTLDTRIVDPGGEYFFGLGRFRRNDLSGALSLLVSPRTSLELGGGGASVHFLSSSSFFDYQSRRFSAGIGFQLTPNLKAVVGYAYDQVPRPPDRPQAESRAHSANLSLSGDLLPLLSGELALGYRRQQNPHAGEGGQSYSGLVFSGALTRQLAPEANLSLYLSRALPVSAYQANGFYVSTVAQVALQIPLPLALQLRFGAGHQWNGYRASEEGGRRQDRIFSWYATLRRALRARLALSGSYRFEQRRSSLADFETDSSGLLLQLEWQVLGGAPR